MAHVCPEKRGSFPEKKDIVELRVTDKSYSVRYHKCLRVSGNGTAGSFRTFATLIRSTVGVLFIADWIGKEKKGEIYWKLKMENGRENWKWETENRKSRIATCCTLCTLTERPPPTKLNWVTCPCVWWPTVVLTNTHFYPVDTTNCRQGLVCSSTFGKGRRSVGRKRSTRHTRCSQSDSLTS